MKEILKKVFLMVMEKNSKRNGYGYGEMHYEDGSIYKGLWKNDQRNGKGKLNYSNVDYYIGDFLNDKYYGQGKGKIHYGNDDYFEGNFIDGIKEDEGIIYKKIEANIVEIGKKVKNKALEKFIIVMVIIIKVIFWMI